MASVSRCIGRIDEHGNASSTGHQLTQEFQPLCHQLGREKIDPRQVAARPGEARDQTEPDRVFGDARRRWGSSWLPPWPPTPEGCLPRDDHGDLPADQIGRQRRQPIELILGPAVFDRHVLALDIAGVLQALAKSAHDGPLSRQAIVLSRNPITGNADCWALATERRS